MRTSCTLGLAAALGSVMALAASPHAGAQTSYLFTNFDGPLGAIGTTINGISNNGVEVGFNNFNGSSFNFLRNLDGTLVEVSAFNMLSPFAMANGVNDTGLVVGTDGNGHALFHRFGVTGILPPAVLGDTSAEVAFGVNNLGDIVGQFTNQAGTLTPGFLFQNGAFTTFNPVANAVVTNVQGINDNGLAVGFYSTDGVHQHGFAWDTNTSTTVPLSDPSTARTLTDGLFLTQFLGVNDNGEAVGYYQTNNGSQFGFTYDLNTNTYTFLDDPLAAPVGGVQITQITGVDGKGDLAGFFVDANGVQRGFFAAPTIAAVPEPSSLALLLGMALTGARLCRKRRAHR